MNSKKSILNFKFQLGVRALVLVCSSSCSPLLLHLHVSFSFAHIFLVLFHDEQRNSRFESKELFWINHSDKGSRNPLYLHPFATTFVNLVSQQLIGSEKCSPGARPWQFLQGIKLIYWWFMHYTCEFFFAPAMGKMQSCCSFLDREFRNKRAV